MLARRCSGACRKWYLADRHRCGQWQQVSQYRCRGRLGLVLWGCRNNAGPDLRWFCLRLFFYDCALIEVGSRAHPLHLLGRLWAQWALDDDQNALDRQPRPISLQALTSITACIVASCARKDSRIGSAGQSPGQSRHSPSVQSPSKERLADVHYRQWDFSHEIQAPIEILSRSSFCKMSISSFKSCVTTFLCLLIMFLGIRTGL